MDSEHLMGTEYGLSRISGMVLLGENGRIYGTRWDDEPLETDKFVNGEQFSGILVRFGDRDGDEAVSESMDVEGIARDSGNIAENEAGTADSYNLRELAQQDSIQRADENPLIPEEKLILEANWENAVELKNTEKDSSENAEKPMMVASDAVLEETEPLQELQQAQERPMNAYDLLMSQLPQMYPFEDDSVAACVRLELQDIGRMPMSCWIYGSNSFLLHGYYCYRHLILAKVERKREKEESDKSDANNAYNTNSEAGPEIVYLMGVPGIWQHRERYMASMFGFRKFRPVSRENQGSGAFGYWCVELKM